MGFIAILSSWNAITERVKEYYIFLLVLQTGMLGAFMALDFMLFFLFWEVMLVPMYFLIGIWGSANRLYSAIKFFLYTLVGSVIMLLGILALYFAYPRARPASTPSTSRSIAKFALRLRPAVVGVPGVLLRLRGQGADVPAAHLAARRAHRRADRRLGDPGGGHAEDGHLRLPPLQPADSAGGDARVRADDGPALDHRHRLRRAGGAGAEGLEAAGRLLLGQPHGDGDAGHVRAEPGRHHRQHHPAAQSRHLDRRPLPPGRRRLRAAPHA